MPLRLSHHYLLNRFIFRAPTLPLHPYAQLRIHHGAVDQTTITTRPPPEVMAHVRRVLQGMGVEAQMESRQTRSTTPLAFLVGFHRRKHAPGLLMRRQSSQVSAHHNNNNNNHSTAANASGSSSQPSPSLAFDDETSVIVGEPLPMSNSSSSTSGGGGAGDSVPSPLSPVPPTPVPLINGNGGAGGPAYGDPSQDAGDEVRFSVS
ncbi:hypothetical protein CPB84DRAFT_1845261 [Gymnopilus junonius]|uniref:Uncharacterized protein n=1 Tax=Gymnopilus junonius TaxID=109634 RepID=A0A9P5NTB8_GYMJU|nr:hypothetical protein CPB84DRAFT_1845261 [Gymnopilus junonius]